MRPQGKAPYHRSFLARSRAGGRGRLMRIGPQLQQRFLKVFRRRTDTDVQPADNFEHGAFLKAMPKATGARMAGGGHGAGGAVVEPPAQPATLAEIGITKKQSSTAQKLAATNSGADPRWWRGQGYRQLG
jgi:hypothetical protein